MLRWPTPSLRWKLVLGSVLIEVITLTVLVVSNVRLMEEHLQRQVQVRLSELSVLLNTTVGPAMAQLDYATIQGVFAQSRRTEGITYFVLLDHRGKRVASEGWPSSQALPPVQTQIDIRGEAPRLDTAIAVSVGGQVYGQLQFGVSTEFIQQARQQLVRQNIAIAVLELVMSIVLLGLLGVWLTRHLSALEAASASIAHGHFDVSVQAQTQDEIGRVGQAFNTMAQEVRHRLRELGASEARFRGLTALSADWYWEQDAQGVFTSIHGGAGSLGRQLHTPLLGQRLEDVAAVRIPPAQHASHQALRAAREPFRDFEYEFVTPARGSLFISAAGEPVFDAEGRFLGYRGVGKDVTLRNRTVLALERSERLLRLSQQAAHLGHYTIDLNTGQWESSALFDDIMGIGPDFQRDLAGWQTLLHPVDRQRVLDHYEKTKSAATGFSREYRIVRPSDGELRWLVVWGDYECDEQGQPVLQVGAIQDITERKQAEEKIKLLAFFDPLTGLPNRTLLADRLRQALAASARSGQHGAMLFIDLDDFKTLNDTHGHEIGDRLLKQVASRLRQCVREEDTAARIGGDEFVAVLTGLGTDDRTAAKTTELVAAKLLSALRRPYRIGALRQHSSASIGATLFMGQTTSVDELMKQADLAMYRSKAAGRNVVRFFDPAMEAAVRTRAQMEEQLRLAVQRQEFVLHFQAQVTDDGSVTGAEVLVRWLHPERGLVPPGEFITLAEETDLILPLGRWVLDAACAQLAEWAATPDLARLTLAVNVSSRQFGQADFVGDVLDALDRSGARPAQLKLELTESLLVRDVDDVIEKMGALKARGVAFSLDDFGTGYSSLSYLKRLPLDQLKIDRSFVRDVQDDANNAAIAQTIVALAQSLGLSVIAEGVETTAQRDALQRMGCKAYQGFLFSRPVALAPFLAWMRQG